MKFPAITLIAHAPDPVTGVLPPRAVPGGPTAEPTPEYASAPAPTATAH
ncbi:hypothetical protein PV343_16090 [Streptomyces sp. WI03-4A]|nr:hypothetical protein [Streptomyces sp. WI03-4A]MDX2593745.1 hypothetical protein [Streptomyces sp. WI03-4A]